jgi:hypothetical protein
VCTSQRVTDVVLKAFMAAAASQGDMNNLTFGAGGKNKKGVPYFSRCCLLSSLDIRLNECGVGEHVEGWGYYEVNGSFPESPDGFAMF